MTERGHVRLEGVGLRFGPERGGHVAVEAIDVDIPPGQFVCFLGPSGCGKSSLLNSIAGFLTPFRGRVLVDGAPVQGPGPDRGMVFQQYSLFPWKTVLENVAFGPRMAGMAASEAEALARAQLETVGLAAYAERFPATLSGGMQQRVGIARALAGSPSVLLMDEPFGALDAQTRSLMQEMLLTLWSRVRSTVFFVTHDIDEALFLGDRVVVMSAGPGRILLDLEVALERPRAPDVLATPGFMALKRRCLSLIRAESLRAFETQPRAAAR